MLVKILTNLGSKDFPDCAFLEDETHDVDETVRAKLIKRGVAIDVTPEPNPVACLVAEPAATPDRFSAERSKGKNKPPSK